MSAKDALDRYYSKLAKQTKRKTKNRKPEKEVERFCLEWMRQNHWDVQIYEAKATYNPRQGRYMQQSMKAGTVDCQGVLPDGTFVAVEFKAPGRLSTFAAPKNIRQKQYLTQKIEHYAFGACVDSCARLQAIFALYSKIRDEEGKDAAKQYLLSQLP